MSNFGYGTIKTSMERSKSSKFLFTIVLLCSGTLLSLYMCIQPSGHLEQVQFLSNQLPSLRKPKEIWSSNGVLQVELVVKVHYFEDGPVAFQTRSYNGQIPGPTLMVRRGDTINIKLINELGENIEGPWKVNSFRYPNSTNIHFHGLHVNPTAISDNVFRVLEPGKSWQTTVIIPTNHSTGMYHYHPHLHGSVFVQMGGGMVGAIIVQDDDSDLPEDFKYIQQNIMIVQEFSFKGGFASNLIEAAKASRSTLPLSLRFTSKVNLATSLSKMFPSLHPTNTINSVQNYSVQDVNTFQYNAFYTVNGQYMPKLKIQLNEFRILRMLNAGSNELLQISIPECFMYIIASDGKYREKRKPTKIILIVPGGRVDIGVQCLSTFTKARLIPIYSKKNVEVDSFLGNQTEIYEGIISFLEIDGNLANPMPVPSTLPIPSTQETEDLTQYDLQHQKPFYFEFSMLNAKKEVDGFNYKQYFVNNVEFSDKPIHNMKLNEVQEWVLSINPLVGDNKYSFKNHPFHIHTNAFQIVNVTNGAGLDYDIGDFRDSITIPMSGSVTIRFRPIDFVGNFPAHCHILGHSDAGMIALVNVHD